jgi:mannose-6-phosphate isomerase
MSFRGHIVLLPPNRVWRTYPGGATLDQITQQTTPTDSHFAEDWIGSTTRAVNPARETVYEGVSQVTVGVKNYDLAKLIESDPDYFLGASHVAAHGLSLKLLVKYLDSAVRLHFQCHPSPEFAQTILNSPNGKTEAYHILGVRDGITDPYIYVGFQSPPTIEAFKEIVESQEITALENCFEKIPIKPGDTYFIPGGIPHALGEGVFMVEIQEPTDFAVRFEYQKAGYVLPEAARFMGRGIDFGLSMVDLTVYPLADVARKFFCAGGIKKSLGATSYADTLIGPDRTDRFKVAKAFVNEEVTLCDDTFSINIVTAGSVDLTVGGRTLTLHQYDKFLIPARLGALDLRPHGSAEILRCYPPT